MLGNSLIVPACAAAALQFSTLAVAEVCPGVPAWCRTGPLAGALTAAGNRLLPAAEMGLGKTVQLAAFLAGLHQSGLFKPTLIVCPATVLRQWLRELRLWYPLFRVVILHDSSKSSSRIRQSRRWALLPAGPLHLLQYPAWVTPLSCMCIACQWSAVHA